MSLNTKRATLTVIAVLALVASGVTPKVSFAFGNKPVDIPKAKPEDSGGSAPPAPPKAPDKAKPSAPALPPSVAPAPPPSKAAKPPPRPTTICREYQSEQPPFFVSNAINKTSLNNWENLRDGSTAKSVIAYIPKNSIVRLRGLKELPDKNIDKLTFVAVEVVSLPSVLTDEAAEDSRDPIKGRVIGKEIRKDKKGVKRSRASVGSNGYIAADALDPASEYTFIVNRSAPMIDIGDGGLFSLADKALKLSMTEDGKYRVRRCCPTDPQNTDAEVKPADPNAFVNASPDKPPKDCKDRFLFDIFDPVSRKILRKDAALSADSCTDCTNIFQHTRAVKDVLVDPLARIVDIMRKQNLGDLASLQFIDSMGMIKLPSDAYAAPGSNGSPGPYGSWHYAPDKGAEVSDDSFMNITSACAFMRVLEEHQNTCKGDGCEIQWGDAYHAAGWKTHKSHDTGHCIDMRPLKKENSHAPQRISFTKDSNYDAKKTLTLIELLERGGATKICFNDDEDLSNDKAGTATKPKASPKTKTSPTKKSTARTPAAAKAPPAKAAVKKPAVTKKRPKYWCAGHDDHIHVCFNPQDKKVQDACLGSATSAPIQ